MNAPLYTIEILRLAASLADDSALARTDGHAEVRSPTCGSRIEVSVALDANGRVAALAQKVHACAFGQASAALMEQGAVARSREDVDVAIGQLGAWLAGEDGAVDWPNLTALAPARSRKSRHAAILLPFRGLLAAMDAAISSTMDPGARG